MRTCQWGYIQNSDEPCDNLVEGNTLYCGSHNSKLRLDLKKSEKAAYKRSKAIEKAKVKASRKGQPNIHKIKAYHSDGTHYTQDEINTRLRASYAVNYANKKYIPCEGCGKAFEGSAHIIAQARCKQLRKTELIWDSNNYFPACHKCNSAIENPKGQEWKKLRNIDRCLLFISQHDNELFQKFMVNCTEEEILQFNQTLFKQTV